MTVNQNLQLDDDVRVQVRERYGRLAADFEPAVGASCCGPDGCVSLEEVEKMYETPDVGALPAEVTGLSLGCGDPVTLASLEPGQTVLDLGSGGGIDCFLAAKQVGPEGKVIGVDMTTEMIEKARANQVKVGAENVEFRLGEIEHLPAADASIDVIISNCVVNLSPDKAQVFREAFRVLRPGGKLAVSDMVTDGPILDSLRGDLDAWVGCLAGALDIKDYVAAIEAAGFVDVQVSRDYLDEEMIEQAITDLEPDKALPTLEDSVYKSVFSARISAWKPAA